MKLLFLLILCLLFHSCNKKDPNPELKDPIYLDLVSERDIMTKSIEEMEKDITSQEKDVKSAILQTGQLKSFENKLFETKNNLTRLKQQKQYFDIKIELRKQEAIVKYDESLHGGKKWPDDDEIKIYRSKLKLYREKMEWDKNGGVVKPVPRGTKKPGATATPPAGGGHGEPAPPPEHH